MTYKINKTDGSLLTEVIDSAVDTTATDLTLIGKNVTGYGEYLNENFIKLLENFANTSEPNNPVTGQIWFDLSENRLKVYDGNGFRIGSGPIVSATPPLSPIQGDFWIDSEENQLYFYDGVDRQLAGPIYGNSQGISGFEVDTITDIDGNRKVIVKLWCAQSLLGIFSKEPEFTPASLIPGFTGTIKPGFNAGNINDFKLNARAASADALVDSLGNVKPTSSFMFTDTDNYTSGSITIANTEPLTLGSGQETSVLVSPSTFQIKSDRSGQDFKITSKQGTTYSDAVTIKAATNRVGIFNNDPDAGLHIGTTTDPQDVVIEGNLTVNGTQTTVNSTVISVDDINIILGDTASPSDTSANGGGITLKGTTDKTITYNNATTSWSSNQNFDVAFGKSYKINGVDILSSTALGSSVTSAPGLTTIGTLGSLTVDNLNINGNTVSSTTGNIILSPVGSGVVDVASSRISNVNDPTSSQDAATKNYVDGLIAPISSPWVSINTDTTSTAGSRYIVSTNSGPVSLVLPKTPFPGDTVRVIDQDGTFDTENLIFKRYREPDPVSYGGTSGVAAIGTYTGVETTNLINNVAVCTITFANPAVVTRAAHGFTVGEAIKFYSVSGALPSPLTETDTYYVKTVLDVDTFTFTDDPDYVAGLEVETTDAGSGTFYVGYGSASATASGLEVTVQLTQNGNTYTGSNTIVTVTAHGTGYKNGDRVKITGDLIGGITPANDFIFDLLLDNIIGQDSDLAVIKADAAIGLTYINAAQGWKFSENPDISGTTISADLVGNVTGDLTGNVTGNVIGNLSGNVTGNLTGTVTGNVTGDLTGDVTGDLTGNVTGNVTGDLTGNVTGDVNGNITTNSIVAPLELSLSAARNIEMNVPVLIKGYDESTKGTLAYKGLIFNEDLNILQYYNPIEAVWQNVGTDHTNMAPRFKLPTYATGDLASLVGLSAGEIIYNIDVNKAQVYDGTSWNNLW